MAGYLGASPVPQTIQKKESFTATAGQTTFNTTGYTDGAFINVYLNGVRLVNGTDYTATNGSDIVLTTGASASDVLDFETFNEFNLVSQEFTNSISVEGDGTFDTAVVTVQNSTKENTDGGRESRLRFRGFKSGDVSPHTLAEIQGSHDGTSNDQKGDLIFKTNDGSDNAAPTERARIDSSGHLLVGATAPTPGNGNTDTGHLLKSDGRLFSSSASNSQFNRNSEGDILTFRQSGTLVGSISSRGGVATNVILRTATGQGAGIGGANSGVLPCDEDGLQDNEINLGASGTRWKDLYLSGGAYLGGTGASNKLEDYEEGTWTPQLDSGVGSPSYSQQHGTYTKIGRQVMAFFYLELNGGTPTSDNLRVINLPFTNVNDSKSYQVTTGYVNSSAGFGTVFTFILFPNDTRLRAYQQNSTSVAQLTGSNLGNGFSFLGRVLYFV